MTLLAIPLALTLCTASAPALGNRGEALSRDGVVGSNGEAEGRLEHEALSRDGVVGSNGEAEGRQRSAFGDFDDGRYINRIAVQGELGLGAGWQADPGYATVDDPALQARLAPRGAFWWQTRDLDFVLQAALQPRWYLGEVAPILQHRPDGLVELDLDARGGERVGVDMLGRFQLDSAQRFPGERPAPFEPWAVPLWGGDMADGLAPTQADLRPVVSLYPSPEIALELGASLELDSLLWLEPSRTVFGRDPELRLGAGPLMGARFLLTPDLALLARGQAHWLAWSFTDGTENGWDWQAWGGLDGRVASFVWLRALAGYGGGMVEAWDLDKTIESGLLAHLEIELGREGPHALALGYRRGPLDLHRYERPEHPHHYAYLRFTERGAGPVEAWIEGGYRQQGALVNELPTAAALSRASLTWWLHDWVGLELAGFYEHGTWIEDGWPQLGQHFYGGHGGVVVGRVQTPSWRRPG
jgi:hypothetical protein